MTSPGRAWKPGATLFFYLGAALIGLVAWAAYLAMPLPAEPLNVDGPKGPLGPVTAGAVVDARFVITNRTHRALQIDRLDASCECTSTDKGPKLIPARGKAELHVSIDTSGRAGEVDFSITCWSLKYDRPIAVIRGSVLVSKQEKHVDSEVSVRPRGAAQHRRFL